MIEQKKHEKNFLDLTESNPTRCGFKFYSENQLEGLTAVENLKYEPNPRGLEMTREAICRYYAEKNIRVEPNQIFLTAGTSEAYSFLFRLLCDPGDAVRTPKPGYPLLDQLAELNDVKLSDTEIPRAVILVNPNNPTGHFLRIDEINKWNAFCIQSRCALISDEVFLDYDWGRKEAPLSLAGNAEVLTFTLSGISKILALPQMKLSWIVVSGPEKSKMQALQKLEIISDAYLSVSAPVQNALPQWLSKKERILSEINQRCAQNFETFRKIALNSPIQVLDSEGGWYAVFHIASCKNDETYAMELLENEGVLIYPGYFFDFEEEGHFVLSLLPVPQTFEAAIDRLVKKGYNTPPI